MSSKLVILYFSFFVLGRDFRFVNVFSDNPHGSILYNLLCLIIVLIINQMYLLSIVSITNSQVTYKYMVFIGMYIFQIHLIKRKKFNDDVLHNRQ